MSASNLLQLDYREAARHFRALPFPIIDVHTHVHGKNAARILNEVAELFGVQKIFSMTPLEEFDEVKESLGERLELIAYPIFRSENPQHAHGDGYLERIREYHRLGARLVKFWAAPRGVDFGESFGAPGALALDTPSRRRAMELACELGMVIMTHVGDPDTWFATKYKDASRYGTKRSQYDSLERLLEMYPTPWMAAHMGGWPEDLNFLSALLEAHPNLHLDTSATKWIVREVSNHSRDEVVKFLSRWKGRILFGSDIVTSEDHLSASPGESFKGDQATTEAEAFELYASRYWALRTLWETDYSGPSPIEDPDLQMVNPNCSERSPLLSGKSLPIDLLEDLYYASSAKLLLA
ncbi:MAG: amidohydrolase family protein [Bdellovibrionales bacterium]|nr:amidohydrolase family protein [Bdellovibrionales bacterium]